MEPFKRKIYQKFLDWKDSSNGKTALLVQGARRIGKTTIVKEFAKKEYESYILIDFSSVSSEIKKLFDDISDLNSFFRNLQFYSRVNLVERKSVIIFDEIQLFPKARQAIKALVADRRYDYIETGSLISIKKNVKDILIPSEERKLNMFPMDYEEFLWAMGDFATFNLLRESFEKLNSFGDALNRKLLKDFRLYMLIGGMPQAVAAFLESNNFRIVDDVKRDILNLYKDDFRKIDGTGRISMLFDAIPSQLSTNASRFNVSSIIKNQRAENVLEVLSELVDSMTVNIAYHANSPSAGLSLNKDIRKFKLFVCDTGLFITLAFKDRDFTENIIYEKLLSDKLSANLGYVYENVVAQMLRCRGDELFYHTFQKENSTHNYEIDFLLSRKNKIVPLEVKSSGYKTHPSLDEFQKKFSEHILQRYLVYTKDLRRDEQTVCLPIYLTMFL